MPICNCYNVSACSRLPRLHERHRAVTGSNRHATAAAHCTTAIAHSCCQPFAQTGWLDLNHNDYLGLRDNNDWQTKVWQRCRALPIGAGGSRLLGGEFAIFQALEEQFAHCKNAPRALFFPSGYAANSSCVPALAKALPQAQFFSDQLNHASLIDGFRLAKIPATQRLIYPHLDYTALEQALSKSRADVNVIITESLFSMDGDTCDLARLYALAQHHRGVLLIDEAHAVGVRGSDGSGLIAEHDLDHNQLISVNTCGKALGSSGAICLRADLVYRLPDQHRATFYLHYRTFALACYCPASRTYLCSRQSSATTTSCRACPDIARKTSHRGF